MSDDLIFRIQNDTSAALRAQCLDGEGFDEATPVNLAGASAATLLLGKPDGSVLSAAMTIESGSSGWVSYQWGSTDLAQIGEHRIQVQITWLTGKVQTFPAYKHAKLVVSRDLG